MLPKKRRKEIVKKINETDRVTVDELTEDFGVSSATIRRDLAALAEDGLIERFHGGALPASRGDNGALRTQKSAESQSDRQAIANQAIDELNDGDAVFFDTGATTREVASAIPDSLSLLVATNSMENAFELRESCGKVKVVGDSLRRSSDALVGPSGESYLQKTNFDVVFLETDGVQEDGGLSVSNEDEARIKSLICEGGRHVVLVADGGKLGSRSFREFATLDDVDVLITDDAVSDEMQETLERADVRVIDELATA